MAGTPGKIACRVRFIDPFPQEARFQDREEEEAEAFRVPVYDSLVPWLLGCCYRVTLGRFRAGLERLFKEHLFHFSEHGIRQLVGACGYRILHAYREDYIDPSALSRKDWAGNAFVRLGAWTAIQAARLLRRQDEVVLYAETVHP